MPRPAQKRARAPRFAAERRREHLLDVAAAMVLDSGFETLTMQGLAQRAGVSKGLGYAYYANADELALALHDREVSALYRRVEAATAGAVSFEEKVRCAVRVYLETVNERGVLIAVLQTKLSGQSRHRSLRRRITKFIRFWARLIGDEYGLRPAAAESLAGASLSAADALTRAWSAKVVGRAEVEELCVGFVLGGIRQAAAAAQPRGGRRRARPRASVVVRNEGEHRARHAR